MLYELVKIRSICHLAATWTSIPEVAAPPLHALERSSARKQRVRHRRSTTAAYGVLPPLHDASQHAALRSANSRGALATRPASARATWLVPPAPPYRALAPCLGVQWRTTPRRRVLVRSLHACTPAVGGALGSCTPQVMNHCLDSPVLVLPWILLLSSFLQRNLSTRPPRFYPAEGGGEVVLVITVVRLLAVCWQFSARIKTIDE